MPEGTDIHPTHAEAGKGMFGKDIAGFPLWVWLVILGAGIGVVLLAKSGKFSGLLGTSSTSQTGSGLGLAVDPTTGLPYAVEGLVPSGGTVGNGSTLPVNTGVGTTTIPTQTGTGTTSGPTQQPIGPVVGSQPTQLIPGKDYPLIPYGAYSGPNYSNLKPGTTYKYQGTTYTLNPGGGGRLWGVNPSGQQVLLYGPQGSYPQASSNVQGVPIAQPIYSTWPGNGARPQTRLG